jgi:hypothetical protein
MSLNLTAAILEAKMSPSLLSFSKQVAATSTFLDGSGGNGGDGVPCPFPGKVAGLQVWDGTNLHNSTATARINPGDRIALFATYASGTFNVTVILNGSYTGVQVTGVAANTTLHAAVSLLLERN